MKTVLAAAVAVMLSSTYVIAEDAVEAAPAAGAEQAPAILLPQSTITEEVPMSQPSDAAASKGRGCGGHDTVYLTN